MHRVVSDYARGDDAANSNIKVYVRARPLDNPSEQTDFISIDEGDDRRIVIRDPDASNRRYGEVGFQFDRIMWTDVSQEEVFGTICRAQVDHVLNGFNSCCFAYGQTGSGKTYTMFGNDGELRGAIPRSVEYLFDSLSRISKSTEVAMVCSFLEIYNDQIRDLGKAYLVAMGHESSSSMALFEMTSDIFESLAGKRGNPYFAPAFHRAGSEKATSAGKTPGIKEVQDEFNAMNYDIREDSEGNVFVKDLSLVPVTSLDEVLSLINMGLSVRATHETKMNATSSRSHTVFTVDVLQRDKMTGQAVSGKLNLVDLAGSERVKKSESQGIRLKEALHINTSLTALGKVIMALDPSSESSHIPYREAKLTRVLQNSLGGNSYTSVIAAIHPKPSYYDECLSTLQFANRCRNVQNNPRVNYVEDTEDKDKRIRKLVDEVSQLRLKLAAGSASGIGGDFGGGRGGGADRISPGRLVAILKKMGMQAVLAADGSITVDGKRFSGDELGLADAGPGDFNSNAMGSSADLLGKSGTRAGGGLGGGGGGDSSGMSVEKLQKVIKELKEANATYSMKAKERKAQMEEQGRELQRLASELNKCETVIAHKEFEISSLVEEKERSLLEQRALIEARHGSELENVVANCGGILQQQQDIVDSVPKALKEYTGLIRKNDVAKTKFETPLRAEFEDHLKHLDSSRLTELEHLRQQYEFFLSEKDTALSEFVENFNAYRTKKAEQLRMAEREIVKLYDYTEQIEEILDNVEKGKYQVHQKQGALGGKSTTGLMKQVGIRPKSSGTSTPYARQQQQAQILGDMNIVPPSRDGREDRRGATGGDQGRSGAYEHDDDEDTHATGQFGSIVLPPGVRPKNPLKNPDTKKDLELTVRIVSKHKERVARLDKLKAEAFQKTLHYAGQTGATATSHIDAGLQEQIRALLVTGPGARGPSRPEIIGSTVRSNLISAGGVNGGKGGRNGGKDKLSSTVPSGGRGNGGAAGGGSGPASSSRPATAESQLSARGGGERSQTAPIAAASAAAADALQRRHSEGIHAQTQQGYTGGTLTTSTSAGAAVDLALLEELEMLRARAAEDQISKEKVLDELASNETVLYIQKLEDELTALRRNHKELATQLQSSKVANNALNRTLEKAGIASATGTPATSMPGTRATTAQSGVRSRVSTAATGGGR